MENHKKLYESLLTALNNNNQRMGSPDKKANNDNQKYKEKNKELLSTNQNLSTQIV